MESSADTVAMSFECRSLGTSSRTYRRSDSASVACVAWPSSFGLRPF